MSLKKFENGDVVINTLKTYPKNKFFIYNSTIYHNDEMVDSGSFSENSKNIPSGHISLYEYNIDRKEGINDFIYPYVTKDGYRTSLKADNASYSYGDTITGSYPLSASIERSFPCPSSYKRALRNRLDYLSTKSTHYAFSSSYGEKINQDINLVSIPSIFFGSSVRPGSVSLKWYLTGSLIAELQDTKYNGELIEVSGSNVGSVAGVVMYDEGFILLTGSWQLSSDTLDLLPTGLDNPRWTNFAAGANDASSYGSSLGSASFDLSFEGTTHTQVMTLFAHAKKNEINFSNNPTYLQYKTENNIYTSSNVYQEDPTRVVKNIVSSSYLGHEAAFKRQVYISRVAIYDESKNLIGIATLSNPILKQEEQDLTFKLKMDF